MQRRNWITIAIFLGVVVVGLGLTRNDHPLLGLDLQGGVAVVLQPKGNPPTDSVEQAKNIIRQRVDALGVAEPDIVRQGRTIVVQLPGVKDRDKALSIIGRTAKLEFRPVLAAPATGYTYDAAAVKTGGQGCKSAPATTSTTTVGGSTTTAPAGGATTTAPAATSSTVATATTTAPAASTTTSAQTGGALGAPGAPPGNGESASGTLPAQATGGTTVPASSTTAAPASSTTAPASTTTAPASSASTTVPAGATALADGQIVLPVKDTTTCILLGPVGFEGKGLSSALAELSSTGEWDVNVKIKGGTKKAANTLMNACYNGDSTCPKLGTTNGQMAIVLDNIVQSYPSVNAINLADSSTGFIITGNFTSSDAKDLALVLKYGALPVEFKKDVNVQEVSATLGKDSLHAGIISGLVGLALVVLYVLVYYRLLGAVAVLSLTCGAGLLWTVIAYLGSTKGLALTLAGITGIIVSIGIAVDSNVVFYEHLREDISKGRTFRSVVNGSFASAWRTIIAADLVSLIAAGLLYILTVGAVRGFAFYLGLSTILDLVASYFLMRPLVMIIARRESLVERPGLLGLKRPPTGEGASS